VATDVVCPTCNTVSHFDELDRDAEGFCSTCDYPLFWATRTVYASATTEGSERAGLRRLPGTEGWAVLERIGCPECSEPNLLTENFCVRCGADLRPQALAPVYVPEPAPPEIEPEPAPAAKRDWLPLLVGAAFVLVCLVVWLVAAYIVY
jgi:hypothetical protein